MMVDFRFYQPSQDDPKETAPPASQSKGVLIYGRLQPEEGDITDEEDRKREARVKENEMLHSNARINTVQAAAAKEEVVQKVSLHSVVQSVHFMTYSYRLSPSPRELTS